jgi:hypothetical protein
MTIRKHWKSMLTGFGLAASLATPALAKTPQPNWLLAVNYGPSHTQSYWHVNMMGRSGVLVGLSPVAAAIRMSGGSIRTFSISHGQFERLNNFVGREISFDVRHDVLHLVAA